MARFQKSIAIVALAGFWLVPLGWLLLMNSAVAALNFWAALTPELQAKCAFPFDDNERFNWHFIPRERKGITWNDMTAAQQALAHAFLASGLSSRGYQQAQTIMSLDQVLK